MQIAFGSGALSCPMAEAPMIPQGVTDHRTMRGKDRCKLPAKPAGPAASGTCAIARSPSDSGTFNQSHGAYSGTAGVLLRACPSLVLVPAVTCAVSAREGLGPQDDQPRVCCRSGISSSPATVTENYSSPAFSSSSDMTHLAPHSHTSTRLPSIAVSHSRRSQSGRLFRQS